MCLFYFFQDYATTGLNMPINTTFGIYIYKRKYGEGWEFLVFVFIWQMEWGSL
jgi:hypothetical protein